MTIDDGGDDGDDGLWVADCFHEIIVPVGRWSTQKGSCWYVLVQGMMIEDRNDHSVSIHVVVLGPSSVIPHPRGGNNRRITNIALGELITWGTISPLIIPMLFIVNTQPSPQIDNTDTSIIRITYCYQYSLFLATSRCFLIAQAKPLPSWP